MLTPIAEDDNELAQIVPPPAYEEPTSTLRPLPRDPPPRALPPVPVSQRYRKSPLWLFCCALLGSWQCCPVYYQIFGSDAPCSSKHAYDTEEPTIGRVLARNISPLQTARIIKRYLAKREGIDESLIGDLYLRNGQDIGEPVQDNDRVPIMSEHGPGSTPEAPLAITLRETPHEPEAPPLSPNTPSSPTTSRSPLPSPGALPPEPAGSLPPMSETEPGKVASAEKLPGWVTAWLARKTGTVSWSNN